MTNTPTRQNVIKCTRLREQCRGCDPDLLLKLFAVVQQGLEVCKAEGSVEAVSIWPCLTNVGVFFVQILQKQKKGDDPVQQTPELATNKMIY